MPRTRSCAGGAEASPRGWRRPLAAAVVALLAVALAAVPGGAVDRPPPVVAAAGNGSGGVWIVDETGGVIARGGATHYGGLTPVDLKGPVVGASTGPGFDGYWLVAADGGIFSFGQARFFGSMGASRLNQPVVAMAPTPSGEGYWLVAADGGIFAFGDAAFYGSMGSVPLNQPVVGMASTPSGRGYWMVAADGGIFAFGDAAFYGSMGSIPLNEPVVGLSPTPSGRGYWMVAADGGIFAFGDASFSGSAATLDLDEPVVGMSPAPSGYLLVTGSGDVLAYGGPDPGGRADVRGLPGWWVADSGPVGEGMQLTTLRRPDQVVTIVEVEAGLGLEADVVMAPGGVLRPGGGIGARTSTLCRLSKCALAVNGDFFDLADREPLGAVIHDGELLRSPRFAHPQLNILRSGVLAADDLRYGALVRGPVPDLVLAGINTQPAREGVTAYTTRAGERTPVVVPVQPPPPPDPDADPDEPPPPTEPPPPPERVVEMRLRFATPGPLMLSTERVVEAESFRSGAGGTTIGSNDVILIGRGSGADRLETLWNRIQDGDDLVQLIVGGDTEVDESLGAAPIMVVGGKPVDPGTANFVLARHPRTAVGQRTDGSLVFVTVDGRSADRAGMTIAELTSLMLQLKVRFAVNLDGGGSSSLVAEGTVRNRTSDGTERSVANALVLRAG